MAVGQGLENARSPDKTLLNDMYELALESKPLPVIIYKQLMTWLLPAPPANECKPDHILSLSLLIPRLPDGGKKRLYQLVVGSHQERADHRTRIASLLEGSPDKGCKILHSIVRNNKAMQGPTFAQMANQLIQASSDREREMLLKLALDGKRPLVCQYEDMISWLMQEPAQDGMDLTTVRIMTFFLFDQGILPECEATWLFKRIKERRALTAGEYRVLMMRIMEPYVTRMSYDLQKLLGNHNLGTETEYKRICIWLLEHLPETDRNSIYKLAVQGAMIPEHLVDSMAAWLLGVTPDSLDHNIPDTVFTKLAYTLKHGFPVAHHQSIVSTLAVSGETITADTSTGSYWDIDLQLLDEYIEISPKRTPLATDQDPGPVADPVPGVKSGHGGPAPVEVMLVWPTVAFQ